MTYLFIESQYLPSFLGGGLHGIFGGWRNAGSLLISMGTSDVAALRCIKL